MHCDATGRADPNGNYQLIDGRLCLRPGHAATFEINFMDAKPAAAAKPDSLDDALRQRFAELAEQNNTDVESLLANLDQRKLEEIAAEVAVSFINALGGGAIARHFTDDQRARIKASAVAIASSNRTRAVDAQAAARRAAVTDAYQTGKDIRDQALADRYRPGSTSAQATQTDQAAKAADTQSIRDAARASRYDQG